MFDFGLIPHRLNKSSPVHIGPFKKIFVGELYPRTTLEQNPSAVAIWSHRIRNTFSTQVFRQTNISRHISRVKMTYIWLKLIYDFSDLWRTRKAVAKRLYPMNRYAWDLNWILFSLGNEMHFVPQSSKLPSQKINRLIHTIRGVWITTTLNKMENFHSDFWVGGTILSRNIFEINLSPRIHSLVHLRASLINNRPINELFSFSS